MENRAIVSVVGKDQVGIIAKVTTVLAENQVNIMDISQTILQDFFTMMMLIDLPEHESIHKLHEQFAPVEKEMGLKISIQLEDIFKAMHRV